MTSYWEETERVRSKREREKERTASQMQVKKKEKEAEPSWVTWEKDGKSARKGIPIPAILRKNSVP